MNSENNNYLLLPVGSGYGVPLGARNLPPTLAWYHNYNPYHYPAPGLHTDNSTPINYPNGYSFVPSPSVYENNLQIQPLMYPNQLYPAKIPFYPRTGRPCDYFNAPEGNCGATGVCVSGVCQRKPTNGKTVFNIPRINE